MTKSEKIKYLLVPAIGFGVGGALLGLIYAIGLFREVGLGIGVILFTLFGSFSLVIIENIEFYKKIIVVLMGVIIWVVVASIYIFGFLIFILPDSPPFDSIFISNLVISLFFLSGPVAIGLFYAVALGVVLKIRIWPVFWLKNGCF